MQSTLWLGRPYTCLTRTATERGSSGSSTRRKNFFSKKFVGRSISTLCEPRQAKHSKSVSNIMQVMTDRVSCITLSLCTLQVIESALMLRVVPASVIYYTPVLRYSVSFSSARKHLENAQASIKCVLSYHSFGLISEAGSSRQRPN